MDTKTSAATWSGWWVTKDRWGQPLGFEAYRRDDDATYYDLYSAPTWWEALLTALELARTVPGCCFESGPLTFTDDLDGRAS